MGIWGGKSSILRESLSSLLTGLHPLPAASPTALLCLLAQPPRKPKPLAGCLYFWQGRGEAGGGCTSLFWLLSEGRGPEDGGTDTWEHRPHEAGGDMGCGTVLGLTKPLSSCSIPVAHTWYSWSLFLLWKGGGLVGRVCPGDQSPRGRLSAPGFHCLDPWESAVGIPLVTNVLLAPHIFCRWPT